MVVFCLGKRNESEIYYIASWEIFPYFINIQYENEQKVYFFNIIIIIVEFNISISLILINNKKTKMFLIWKDKRQFYSGKIELNKQLILF